LAEGQYAKESLTLIWLKQNITNYGGIRNRWATTLGHYVRVLGTERPPRSVIIDLLESVNQPPYWNELVRAAGGIEALRNIIFQLLYGNQNFLRIQSLQQKWNVKLGAA
jgi:hypothetical protein